MKQKIVSCSLMGLLLGGCTTYVTAPPGTVTAPTYSSSSSSGASGGIKVPEVVKETGRVAGKVWDAMLGWVEYGADAAQNKLEEVRNKNENEE